MEVTRHWMVGSSPWLIKTEDLMYQYKVLTTCYAGGRKCREGSIIAFEKQVDNKYLKPVNSKVAPKKKTGRGLSSLQSKPKLTTGMAAKRKKK